MLTETCVTSCVGLVMTITHTCGAHHLVNLDMYAPYVAIKSHGVRSFRRTVLID